MVEPHGFFPHNRWIIAPRSRLLQRFQNHVNGLEDKFTSSKVRLSRRIKGTINLFLQSLYQPSSSSLEAGKNVQSRKQSSLDPPSSRLPGKSGNLQEPRFRQNKGSRWLRNSTEFALSKIRQKLDQYRPWEYQKSQWYSFTLYISHTQLFGQDFRRIAKEYLQFDDQWLRWHVPRRLVSTKQFQQLNDLSIRDVWISSHDPVSWSSVPNWQTPSCPRYFLTIRRFHRLLRYFHFL